MCDETKEPANLRIEL